MSDVSDQNPPIPRGSEGLDTRRRRILFRAWHRGTREMDLMMGRFADAELRDLPDADLADLEALMEVPDRDVFSWLTGELELPANYDTPVFHKVRAFHTHDGPIFK
jgi:antitoxin CptB